MRALRLIAGEEDHRALMLEVCGYDNKTAENIARKYKKVASSAERGNSGWNDRIMKKEQREWCVNPLSFCAGDLSMQQLASLGFPMGRALYDSIKSFACSDDPIYTTPAANYPGRKRLKSATDIGNVWLEWSQIVSRTNKKGENLRVAYGGKANLARSIAANFECSKASAYRYCPPLVVISHKHSDLCIYCEALRKVRIECVRLANARGGNFSLPGDHLGQGAVRQPGNGAADLLAQFADEDEEVENVLGAMKALVWHEKLGESLMSDMKAAYGQKLVAIFDFSGSIHLKGIRGDAEEFFRPPTLSLFGVMFVIPQGGGRFKREYVDIFSFGSPHTSNVAVASLSHAMVLARRRTPAVKSIPEIAFFPDEAKRFLSGEMAHGVLFEVAGNIAGASYTFHACYHGRTPLDGHFGRVKQQIGAAPIDKWPNSKAEAAKLVLHSLRNLGDTQCVFLESKYENLEIRKKLIIRDISCAQKFRRFTAGRPPIDKLTIEGAPVVIRTALLAPGESEKTERGQDFIQKEKLSVSELCEKIKKQQKKMFGFQDK